MNRSKAQGDRVFVALSGGVDSSVAAYLLKEKGYHVTGVFIKAWYPEFLSCTWKEDQLDAMRVCAKLEIPFYTVDLGEEYRRNVVEYMVREYRLGRTPNPDVACNTTIKFGAFLRRALKRGADYIATGHYVSKSTVNSPRSAESPEAEYTLHANPTDKDQSYFLWTLTQGQLAHSLFPIADMAKDQVRTLAKKSGLPTASKKDSQGLCFLGELDMKDFLSRYLTPVSGMVLDTSGTTIGTHSGVQLYTIGQRHGFAVISQENRSPYYVIAKDLKRNTITVAPAPASEAAGRKHEVAIASTNWIAGNAPQESKPLLGRTRYRQALAPCFLESKRGHAATVCFPDGAPLTSPGQSLVLYRRGGHGECELLGGGIINS